MLVSRLDADTAACALGFVCLEDLHALAVAARALRPALALAASARLAAEAPHLSGGGDDDGDRARRALAALDELGRVRLACAAALALANPRDVDDSRLVLPHLESATPIQQAALACDADGAAALLLAEADADAAAALLAARCSLAPLGSSDASATNVLGAAAAAALLTARLALEDGSGPSENRRSAAQSVRQARVVRAIDAKGALTVLALGRFRADPNARIELASSAITPLEHIDGVHGRGAACRGGVGKQLVELTRSALVAIGARGE